MQVKTDENSLIVAYAIVGQLEGGIEVDAPDDFINNFKPKYYMLQNNKVIVNPDYTEPSESSDEPSNPTAEQIALTALAQGCSGGLERIKSLEESVTALAQDLGDEK